MKKMILALALILCYGVDAIAQIPSSKETKDYEYFEEASVKSASSGELFHRFYYWGLQEFDGLDFEVVRDDTNFIEIVFHVNEPMVQSNFGVNRVHKERMLTYDLTITAEKKNYSYRLNEIHYKTMETDRKVERELAGRLKNLKTPAKKSMEEEIHEALTQHIASLKKGANAGLTAGQEAESDAWVAERKLAHTARKDVRKAAQMQAEKEADAAAKAKEEAEEKLKDEADAKAKAAAEAKKEAEAEAKAKAQAEAKAKLKAEAEARSKAQAEARAKVKAEAEAKSKAQAEARAKMKAEAEAKAKAQAEARAKVKAEAEAKAKAEAEARAKAKAEAEEAKSATKKD